MFTWRLSLEAQAHPWPQNMESVPKKFVSACRTTFEFGLRWVEEAAFPIPQGQSTFQFFEETCIPAFLRKCSWANLRPCSFELTGRSPEHAQV